MYSIHGRDACNILGNLSIWKDNIKMDHKEIRCGKVDCIHLTQDIGQWWAVVDMIVPENVGAFSTDWSNYTFSRTLPHRVS
jgi:hypothetical protein